MLQQAPNCVKSSLVVAAIALQQASDRCNCSGGGASHMLARHCSGMLHWEAITYHRNLRPELLLYAQKHRQY